MGAGSVNSEDQHSVGLWAEQTFGTPTPLRCAIRTNSEMAEFLDRIILSKDPILDDKLHEELADLQIMLYNLANVCGADLVAAVNSKMAINRARTWAKDGRGCGQHV